MQVSDTKSIGNLGESIAVRFLQRKGFVIIERNYRKPWGEIDIIAEKAGVVRFVEVKAVSREIPAADISREIEYRPEELVHSKKLRNISRTASLYMENARDSREYQIDVVGVILDTKKSLARCRLFEQVLE